MAEVGGGGVFAEEEGVLAKEGGGSSLGYLFAMLGFLSHKKQGKNINYLHSQLSTSIQTIFHFICRIFEFIYFFSLTLLVVFWALGGSPPSSWNRRLDVK